MVVKKKNKQKAKIFLVIFKFEADKQYPPVGVIKIDPACWEC